MIKNSIFLMAFIAIISKSFSQQERSFFVDKEGDYVVLLDKNVKHSEKTIAGAEIALFIKSTNEEFNYTLTITKAPNSQFSEGNLTNGDFDDYYEKTCNCEILTRDIAIYNNLKSIRYKIKTKNDNKSFLAFSDNFVSNGTLFNVMFMSFEDQFVNEEDKYINIINSLLIILIF